RQVLVVAADPGPERGDQQLDLLRRQHLIEAGLLDVQDLSAQRQDRLVLPVASLLRRATCRVALDDEQLRERRVTLLAVRQLAGERAAVERPLAAREVLRLARRLAHPRRLDALRDDAPRLGGMLLEVDRQAIVDQRLDDALHLAVAELRLRLALELWLRDLDADDGRQALAHVVALKALVVLLQQPVGHRVGVDRAGQGGAQADQMRTALDRVDVVGEGVDALGVAVVPLHGDLDVHAVSRTLQIDHVGVDRRLGAVQVRDEGDDATLVQELVRLPVALVADGDADATIQERQLAQALRQDVEAEVDVLEDQRVGLERDARPAELRDPRLLDGRLGLAALVALLVDLAVTSDLDLERLRERVHHGHADAMKPA